MAAVALGPWASGELAAQEGQDRPPDIDLSVVVRGKVVDHNTGDPVRGAAVSLAAGPFGTSGLGTRVSDQGGQFVFRDVPPGAYRISVTIRGYQNMADTVLVLPEENLELILPLSFDRVRHEPIVAEPLRPAMQGFEYRRGSRSGTFITREQIERRHPSRLTEVLVTVPGGRIAPSGGFGNTLLLRGGCGPTIWIDGVKIMNGGGIDELVTPREVEAVEVYHAHELPVEFGVDFCGGVLIWTRIRTP